MGKPEGKSGGSPSDAEAIRTVARRLRRLVPCDCGCAPFHLTYREIETDLPTPADGAPS